MTDWQPIETAPKDGSLIWLARPGHMRVGWWRKGEKYECHGSVSGGWGDLARSEAMGPSGMTFAPTKWMPLPDPPKD